MSERDQAFFDALSGGHDNDDREAPSNGAPGPWGAQPMPVSGPLPVAGPGYEVAGGAAGRHHSQGAAAGQWGQEGLRELAHVSDGDLPEPTVEDRSGEVAEVVDSEVPRHEQWLAEPPEPAIQAEGWSPQQDAAAVAQTAPPLAWAPEDAVAESPGGAAPAGAAGPYRPVPPEERTQYIPRDAIREGFSRPPTASPGWPAPHAGPVRPGVPVRAVRGPERAPRRTELTEPLGSLAGPRPPVWEFGSPVGSAGGAELRSEQITAAELVAPRKIASSRGWRKWLYRASFGRINVGESPDEQVLRTLNATVGGHLRGTYSVVVAGGKGGVGKTTTTAAVGSTFASLRNDKTIAIDANPDRASNLADRIDPSATNSYQDVLADRNLQRYSDVRSHVGQNDAGLDVLGNRYQADRPPLSARIYAETHDRLQRFYSVLISDSGTDVDHPVVGGLMSRADAMIMVASTAPDGAKGAAELMDWAYEAGYHRLLQHTVVVINDVRGDSGKASRAVVESLVEKFSRWVGAARVFVVPFDPHIAAAGVISLDELRPATRRAFLAVTAKVASGFNATAEDLQ